jgi:hypothetical protein
VSDQIFGTIDLVIAATFFCAVIAMVIWVRAKPHDKADKKKSDLHDQRTASALQRAGDWASAAVNLVIGVLLGVAINGLARLMFSGAWLAVINLLVLFAALSLIVWLHDRLGDWLFPSGIRPARNPRRVREKPLFRRLSLPAGLLLGLVLAGLGWDGWLYRWVQ